MRTDQKILLHIFFRRAGAEVRDLIKDFAGLKMRVEPLPRSTSLCGVGGPRNCRCSLCRAPAYADGARRGDDAVLYHLARKAGRGRAIAARWVYLLSGLVALRPGHGTLQGMFLVVYCGRGPYAYFLNLVARKLWNFNVNGWIQRWFTALFLQYVEDRSDIRGLMGTASSALLNIRLS